MYTYTFNSILFYIIQTYKKIYAFQTEILYSNDTYYVLIKERNNFLFLKCVNYSEKNVRINNPEINEKSNFV